MYEKKNDKTNKGNNEPGSSIIEKTLDQVKKVCNTNNKLFAVRNILELLENGAENTVRNFIKKMKDNRNNVQIIIPNDELTHKVVSEIENPAKNLGYSILPITLGVSKGKIDPIEFKEFTDDYNKIIKDLEALEAKAIYLQADANIQNNSSYYLKNTIEQKTIQLTKEKEALKKEEEKKIALKKAKNQRKREKQKAKKLEQAKKQEILNKDDKSIEEWKTYAKENNIAIVGLSLKDDIFNAIVNNKDENEVSKDTKETNK